MSRFALLIGVALAGLIVSFIGSVLDGRTNHAALIAARGSSLTV